MRRLRQTRGAANPQGPSKLNTSHQPAESQNRETILIPKNKEYTDG